MHGEACSRVMTKKPGTQRSESTSRIVRPSQRVSAYARREWSEELVPGQSKPGPDDPDMRLVAAETGTSGRGQNSSRGPTTRPSGVSALNVVDPGDPMSRFGVSVARTGLVA